MWSGSVESEQKYKSCQELQFREQGTFTVNLWWLLNYAQKQSAIKSVKGAKMLPWLGFYITDNMEKKQQGKKAEWMKIINVLINWY